jgi:beta-ureidopropionase / N-carbamoyl-L-amino-acid hydrolase
VTIRVDPDRLRRDFDALAAIGATADGGVDRIALSPAHLEARAWFLQRAADAGLATAVDAAGNHSAVLHGPSADAPKLLLGSHLDSVPNGGRYDGALGVVAALEVLRVVKEEGLELPYALEAIDFTDEEGTLVGLLGSRALAGDLDREALTAPRGGRAALLAALARAGLDEMHLADARRGPGSTAGYLELHIEQGPLLERARAQIGIVTAIVGSRSFELVFEGVAAHAGTTPMDARRDAAFGAAAFTASVRGTVADVSPGAVATVGRIELEPGVFNVVPGRARVALEFRASSSTELDRLEERLLDGAAAVAAGAGLRLEVEPVGRWEPTPLDASARRAITAAAAGLGLNAIELPSGAGHDAQALAAIAPAGMIFVPSAHGISHQPQEHTPWGDCVNGANVLLHAALELSLRARP